METATIKNEPDKGAQPVWYVLNHIGGATRNTAQKSLDLFNQIAKTNLELFAPTYTIREVKNGVEKFRDASLTFHYVFVKGTFDEVKRLCGQPTNKFSFLLNRSGKEPYATIDDRKMMQFKNIAKAYKNCLPCFSLEEVDLEDGDLVQVVTGPFAGVTGRFIPKAKSKNGNVVLNVYGKLMTIVYDVKSLDVRVLEFSRNSTRANDQIDAFVPYLLKSLRIYYDNGEQPQDLIAKLTIFCGRMGAAKLNNRKLDARLQVLLYAGNKILFNAAEAEVHLEKFKKVMESVTNAWTQALLYLILAVIDFNRNTIEALHEKYKDLEATSKMQKMVAEEYRYYLEEAD